MYLHCFWHVFGQCRPTQAEDFGSARPLGQQERVKSSAAENLVNFKSELINTGDQHRDKLQVQWAKHQQGSEVGLRDY